MKKVGGDSAGKLAKKMDDEEKKEREGESVRSTRGEEDQIEGRRRRSPQGVASVRSG